MMLRILRPTACAALRQATQSTPSLRYLHASGSRRYPASDGGLSNILSGGEAPPVQVKTITPNGIQLADGLSLPSACIFLDGKVFLWNVPERTWEGWKPEHFEIFETVVPKPGKSYYPQYLYCEPPHKPPCTEILLLGTGERVEMIPSSLRQYLNNTGIQVDVMNTVSPVQPASMRRYI